MPSHGYFVWCVNKSFHHSLAGRLIVGFRRSLWLSLSLPFPSFNGPSRTPGSPSSYPSFSSFPLWDSSDIPHSWHSVGQILTPRPITNHYGVNTATNGVSILSLCSLLSLPNPYLSRLVRGTARCRLLSSSSWKVSCSSASSSSNPTRLEGRISWLDSWPLSGLYAQV